MGLNRGISEWWDRRGKNAKNHLSEKNPLFIQGGKRRGSKGEANQSKVGLKEERRKKLLRSEFVEEVGHHRGNFWGWKRGLPCGGGALPGPPLESR